MDYIPGKEKKNKDNAFLGLERRSVHDEDETDLVIDIFFFFSKRLWKSLRSYIKGGVSGYSLATPLPF